MGRKTDKQAEADRRAHEALIAEKSAGGWDLRAGEGVHGTSTPFYGSTDSATRAPGAPSSSVVAAQKEAQAAALSALGWAGAGLLVGAVAPAMLGFRVSPWMSGAAGGLAGYAIGSQLGG